MRIDWQSYDAGLMEPDQLAIVEEALKSDPMAMRELVALRALKSKINQCGNSEPVPQHRLQRVLRRVARSRRPSLARYGLVAAAIVCSAVGIALLANVLLSEPAVGIDSKKTVSSAAEAQTWARENSGLAVPRVSLASMGKINSVHAHTGWACYDYEVQGLIVHIGISAGSCGQSDYEKVETPLGTLLVDHSGKAIRFESDGLTYTVLGGTQESRLEAAKQAWEEVAAAKRGKLRAVH